MKRFLTYFSIFIVVLIIALGVASVTILPAYLKNIIEEKFSESTGGRLTIGRINVSNYYPYTLNFQNSLVESPILGGSIANLTVGVGFGPRVSILVQKANLKLKSESAKPETNKKEAPSSGGMNIPNFPLALSLDVKESSFTIQNPNSPVVIQNTNLKIGFESLTAPIKINGSAQALVLGNILLPVGILSEVQLQNGSIVIRSAEVSVLSLKSSTTGYVRPQTMAMDFNIKLKADELDKIPIPKDVPLRSWAGGINVEARALRKDAKDPMKIDGKFTMSNLKIQPEFKNKDMDINGLLLASSSGEFKISEKVYVQNLKWDADLTKLIVKYKNLLDKPLNVPLTSKGELSVGEKINVKEGGFRFDTILLNASGVYDTKGPSDFKIDLKPTALKGLEKYFPIIREYPLEGSVEARGRIAGDLSKPDTLALQFDPIVARSVRGKVSYKTDKINVNGIISADINGKLQTQGKLVQAGTARAFIDVSAMEIQIPEVMTKKSGQTLRLDIDAGKVKDDFLIKKGTLQTYFGNLMILGKPPLSLADKMTLKVSSNGINLRLVPVLSKILKSGDMKFDLGINGSYNSENFWASPMSVAGEVLVDLSEYKIAGASAEAKGSGKEEPPPASEVKAFLPDSSLVNGLNINVKGFVGYFAFDKLVAKKISVVGKVSNRMLSINSGTVGEVFGGSVNLRNVSLPLTVNNPVIKLESDFSNLDVAQALGFVNPQWKDLAKGKVTGDLKGKTLLPGSPKFMDEIAGDGKFNLANGQLSTLNFETMVKEKLSKIPGAKDMNLSRGPLNANMDGTYKLEKKVLKLSKFHGITPRNEEMNLTGIVGMDMSVDLQGSVSLVDWPGGGDLYEANKDAKGRINIPVNVVGNAMNPELSFAGDTIKQMIGKVAEYELKKRKKGIEENLKKDLESKLKNIFK